MTIGNRHYIRLMFLTGVVMILSAFSGIIMSDRIPVISARITKVQELRDSRVSYVLIRGRLTSAPHEETDGWWSVGQHMAVIVKPDGTPHMILREFKDKDIELVIREVRK